MSQPKDSYSLSNNTDICKYDTSRGCTIPCVGDLGVILELSYYEINFGKYFVI